ncbi:MAG: hypothetical protein JSR82_11100 [Verrucomicrobia bacterium]|nr:hypothetical protein [Verrucomicrobiota bacterium]
MLPKSLAVSCLFVLSTCTALAGVNPSVSVHIRTTGYTGFLIEADQVTGRVPSRALIRGEWAMNFAWDGLDNAGANFESVVWLEDQDGNAVPIIPQGGGPVVTELSEVYQVSLDSGNPTDNHTFQVAFVPQQRLQAQNRYRLRAKWRRAAGALPAGPFTSVPVDATAASTAQYQHFTNTMSADAAVNASVSAELLSWEKRWRIGAQTGFLCTARVLAWRFDGFEAAAQPGSVTARLTASLRNASGTTVWTQPEIVVALPVPTHDGGTGAAAEPTFRQANLTVELTVPPNVLVPGELYTPVFTIAHDDDGTAGVDGSRAFAAERLLSLTGNVSFGSVQGVFDAVTNDPAALLDPNATPLPTTLLAVAAGHGFLPAGGGTFGNVALDVRVQPNGDAIYIGEAPIAVGGLPAQVNVNGIAVARSNVTVGTGGASAGQVSVRLPRGLGYSLTPGQRTLRTKVVDLNAPLNAQLLPLSLGTGGPVYLALDRLPLVFRASTLTVDFATGRFRFFPETVAYDSFLEIATLENYQNTGLLPAGFPLHGGNDQHFRFATVNPSDQIEISAGPDGAAFVHTLRLGFTGGTWYTHFPYLWYVRMQQAGVVDGSFRILNDRVAGSSDLRGVNGVLGFYVPNAKPEANQPTCPSGLPVAPGRFFAFAPDANTLRFTADGSLLGSGQIVVPTELDPIASLPWGTISTAPLLFAHAIINTDFTPLRGKVLLPGTQVAWAEAGASGVIGYDRAAASQLTGRSFQLAGGELNEFPGTDGYLAGQADYAGFNVRRSENATLEGRTLFGGTGYGPYALLPETKLYFRPGGVSGMVQSQTPLDVTVNGFPMHFDGVKLAYLDTVIEKSKLDGSVTVGGPAPAYPASVQISFRNLRLFGNGALDRGEVAPEQGSKRLDYWRTDFDVLSLSFVQPDACAAPGSTPTLLALGIQTRLPAFTDQLLGGVLGFRPNASLVARDAADNNFAITGIDSRLRVPGNVRLKGPGASNYSVTPASGAYFNDWPGAGGTPSIGFANVFGAIDVPFFDSLNAHLQANAGASAESSVYVMLPPDSASAFEQAYVDPTNHGTPVAPGPPGTFVDLTTYRTAATYFTRARKDWLGLIKFDYPLEWNPSARSFRTKAGQEVSDHLAVAQVRSQVRSLTPSTADLKFRADVGLPLPSVDANKLLGEVLDGASGALAAIAGVSPDFPTALNALAVFEQCLADTPDKLVRGPLIEAIHSVRQAAGSTPLSPAQLRTALAAQLNVAFSQAVGGSPLPSSWKHEVFLRLDQVTILADSLLAALNSAQQIVQLANAFAPTTEPPGATTAGSVLPADVQETINSAKSQLTKIRSGIAALKNGINAVTLTPDWNAILLQALPDAPALPDLALPLAQASDAEVADAILAYFLGDFSAGRLAEEMRVHLSDTRDQVRGALDGVFAGVNELLQKNVAAINPVASPMGLLPDLKFGRIDGQARINGDSLHELRLDADFKISVGTEFAFKAWLLFRDLSSETPGNACSVASGIQAELTLGATTQFNFGVPAAPVTVEAEAKFAFGSGLFPTGLAGRLSLAGSGFKLGILTITRAELGFGFGDPGDAYLYGAGAGKSDYSDIEAAFLFGRSCDLRSVVGRIDAQTAELLDHPAVAPVFDFSNPNPTYGFYVFGYGTISVNSLIGIPPSPMLNLKAGAGLGAFFFTRQQQASSAWDYTLGLRGDLGISGEVLAIADIAARVSLVGATGARTISSPEQLLAQLATPPSQIVGNGSASFSITLGISPFDVTLSKTLRLQFGYQPLQFSLDL